VPGAGLRPGAGVLCRRDLGSGRRWRSGLVPCGILADLGLPSGALAGPVQFRAGGSGRLPRPGRLLPGIPGAGPGFARPAVRAAERVVPFLLGRSPPAAQRPAGPQRRGLPGDRVWQPALPRLRCGPGAAYSHSPDGARLRTSCPVLAIGGLRSGYRRSVTGRRRVAGTGAFRRPDDHPAGSGIARGPGGGFAPPRLSTCPQPRLSTCAKRAEQRIYPNHPQAYPQGVTLGKPKGCR
jgi:hypothetical protein